MNNYKDLKVWKKSVDLAVKVYEIMRDFPREEIYGLSAQLRRAGVSTASNIAEGWGRGSRGEFRQFLGTARGSNFEIQTQLVIVAILYVQCSGIEPACSSGLDKRVRLR